MSDSVLVHRPAIARDPRKMPTAAIVGIFAVLGLAIFLWLSSARTGGSDVGLATLATMTATDPAPAIPAPETAAAPAAVASNPFTLNASPTPVTVATNTVPMTGGPSGYSTVSPPVSGPIVPVVDPLQERSRAPALVIDFALADKRAAGAAVQVRQDEQAGDTRITTETSTIVQPATSSSAPAAGSAGGSASALSDNERFANRVGNEETDVANARQMVNLDRMVPQGTIIGAVMETALNSDLPGYARAIISREVRSFDGSTVLIPAGSRVIGQYKSGVAQGASRVFVVWTRLIRQDGVTIELGSPATDDLGRAGIGGKVNRHFLQRFGGAILTSVLSGGINAAAASLSRGSTIVVTSASEASSLASQAGRTADIPPTITTRQGARVRIFVARDLDFSRVGPVR